MLNSIPTKSFLK